MAGTARRRWFVAVAAGVTIARAAPAQCPDGSAPPCTARAPAPTSIAVLYLDNLSTDSADAYLADGLTEEIINRLGRLERLVVKSQTSVRRYRGRAGEPATMGRALGVSHLLNGSVRRAGNRLRVSVELVRASTGERLWGERYDRADADVLAIEEEIARAVATAVSGRLLPAERATLATRATTNAAAYDHFLRGNYHLAQRNPASFVRAIEQYEAAVARDPRFSRARARIAYAYALYFDWEWSYPGLSGDSLLVRALAASDEALRLDPGSADSWLARGYLLIQRNPRTLEGARSALERAVALEPDNIEALAGLGWGLMLHGEDSAAIALQQRLVAKEPDRSSQIYQIARLHQLSGRLTEARRWLDSAIAVDPRSYFAHGQRGQVRLLLGDVAGARQDAERTVALIPPTYRPYRFRSVMLYVRADLQAGDTVRARARIDHILREENLDRPTVLEGWYLGMALVALGNQDTAMDFLERVHPRGAKLHFGLRMPEFDALRANPRFQRLMAETRPPAPGR
jgi:TolB-like protein/predicted Zn-dependent protease